MGSGARDAETQLSIRIDAGEVQLASPMTSVSVDMSGDISSVSVQVTEPESISPPSESENTSARVVGDAGST